MTPYHVYAKSDNTVDVYPYIKKAVNKLDKLNSFKYTVADVYGDGEELRCTIYNGETPSQYIEVHLIIQWMMVVGKFVLNI